MTTAVVAAATAACGLFMSRELLLHPDWHTRDVSSLKLMGGGGAPLQPDLVETEEEA